VLKNVEFFDACGRMNKISKSPNTKTEERKRERHRLTNVSKTPSSSINSVVLPINNNTLYKR
jgi:hypothetical protein